MRQGEKIQNQKAPTVDHFPLSSETSKKLNFGVTYNVFKNLLPLNVNDSILPPPQQNVFRSAKVNKNNVDPSLQPDLRDFLTPMPPLVHYIPEPELRLEFDYPRGFDVYKSLD